MAGFLRRSGADPSGRPVIAGGFDLVSTLGVPLELLVERMDAAGMMVDWPDYILSAVGAGQNLRSLRVKMTMAVGECFGPTYREEFERRLGMLLSGIEHA